MSHKSNFNNLSTRARNSIKSKGLAVEIPDESDQSISGSNTNSEEFIRLTEDQYDVPTIKGQLFDIFKSKRVKSILDQILNLNYDYEIDFNWRNIIGNTPLMEAMVRINDEKIALEVAKYLIENGKAEINVRNSNQMTLVQLIVEKDYDEILQLICDHHCAINDVANATILLNDNYNGSTVLHTACQHASLKCLKFLITKTKNQKIDLYQKTIDGRNCLQILVSSNRNLETRYEMLEYLLITEPELIHDTSDNEAGYHNEGATNIFHYCARRNYSNFFKILMDFCLEYDSGTKNPNLTQAFTISPTKDNLGATALNIACQYGSMAIVNQLLDEKLLSSEKLNEWEKEGMLNFKQTKRGYCALHCVLDGNLNEQSYLDFDFAGDQRDRR